MLEMVAKYTKSFTTHVGNIAVPKEDVVVITGTTGAIGSNVLAELAKSSNVSKIYALTRKTAIASIVRQKEALESRGLNPALVDGVKVVVVDADLGRPGLGLAAEVLEQVRVPRLPL